MTNKTYDLAEKISTTIPHCLYNIAPELTQLLKNAHHSNYSDLENAAKFANLADSITDWIEILRDWTESLQDYRDKVIEPAHYSMQDDLIAACGQEIYEEWFNHECDTDNYKL